MRSFFIPFFFAVLFSACSKKQAVTTVDPVERGKQVYVQNCSACHNLNAKLDGTVGPSVFGSSEELLLRRVVHGDYPPGYQPKRKTRLMAPLPHLRNDIPALHAYLNSP